MSGDKINQQSEKQSSSWFDWASVPHQQQLQQPQGPWGGLKGDVTATIAMWKLCTTGPAGWWNCDFAWNPCCQPRELGNARLWSHPGLVLKAQVKQSSLLALSPGSSSLGQKIVSRKKLPIQGSLKHFREFGWQRGQSLNFTQTSPWSHPVQPCSAFRAPPSACRQRFPFSGLLQRFGLAGILQVLGSVRSLMSEL